MGEEANRREQQAEARRRVQLRRVIQAASRLANGPASDEVLWHTVQRATRWATDIRTALDGPGPAPVRSGPIANLLMRTVGGNFPASVRCERVGFAGSPTLDRGACHMELLVHHAEFWDRQGRNVRIPIRMVGLRGDSDPANAGGIAKRYLPQLDDARARLRATIQEVDAWTKEEPPSPWTQEKERADQLAPVQATPEHPVLTLCHALNALHMVCSSANLFRELAERRERAREVQLHFLSIGAKIASDRANELARAGAPCEQQWAALTEGMDRANDPPPSSEPAEYTKSLRESVLNHGPTWCEQARAALRAGGAKGLDAATHPNAAGQTRSIELHTKLQDAERVFVGLTVGVGDPRIIIDKDAEIMADLGEWFARTRDELGAVFETRGLDGDDLIARLAVAPAPPILSDDELARLRAHLKAPLRLSAMKGEAERDRWRTLREVLNFNDELRADASGTPVPLRGATPKATRRERRAKWLAEAMLTVRDHPEWPDAKIADRVGIDKSRLSRSPEYRAAASMARTPKTPEGSVRFANGDRELEAVDDSFDPNRSASRQWQDEEDTDDRIDREMRETQRKTQRGAVNPPVNRRSGGA